MRLLEIIKQAGVGAVEAGNPVAIMFGTVTQTNPLEVSIDQRLILSEDFLVIPEQLTPFTVDLKHSHSYKDGVTEEALTEPVVIRKGLETGDKLLLLRVQGGQQFIILDKLVNV
ncbi:DUF2577 domain-containing protein [Paenibacillus hamazuiensis]|uniref:DUF2577 domain-containing protein n=1 Tax=Paenibacillus hamazuiensis TaxID=2936508 RepID=UPI00200BA8B1|nr:DUF2577 domain-containing protein [Paenibacillus hamazuiensis]